MIDAFKFRNLRTHPVNTAHVFQHLKHIEHVKVEIYTFKQVTKYPTPRHCSRSSSYSHCALRPCRYSFSRSFSSSHYPCSHCCCSGCSASYCCGRCSGEEICPNGAYQCRNLGGRGGCVLVLEAVEGVLCLLEVLKVMRCMLFCTEYAEPSKNDKKPFLRNYDILPQDIRRSSTVL